MQCCVAYVQIPDQQAFPDPIVFAENQIRIVFEQCLDLFQVAICGCVMNLTAEDGAAKSVASRRNEREFATMCFGLILVEFIFILTISVVSDS